MVEPKNKYCRKSKVYSFIENKKQIPKSVFVTKNLNR